MVCVFLEVQLIGLCVYGGAVDCIVCLWRCSCLVCVFMEVQLIALCVYGGAVDWFVFVGISHSTVLSVKSVDWFLMP